MVKTNFTQQIVVANKLVNLLPEIIICRLRLTSLSLLQLDDGRIDLTFEDDHQLLQVRDSFVVAV